MSYKHDTLRQIEENIHNYKEERYQRYRRTTGKRILPPQQTVVIPPKPANERLKMGNALVLPGEIQAVDSTDLVTQLLAQNTAKIWQKVDKRVIDKWLQERKAQLRSQYTAKATQAYNKMWNICTQRSVGHNFKLTEVRGYNIQVCEDCKFAAPQVENNAADSFQFNRQTSIANSMNNDLAKLLAERMIEVDIEAGIFEWPTAQDYPNIASPEAKKKRRIFG